MTRGLVRARSAKTVQPTTRLQVRVGHMRKSRRSLNTQTTAPKNSLATIPAAATGAAANRVGNGWPGAVCGGCPTAARRLFFQLKTHRASSHHSSHHFFHSFTADQDFLLSLRHKHAGAGGPPLPLPFGAEVPITGVNTTGETLFTPVMKANIDCTEPGHSNPRPPYPSQNNGNNIGVRPRQGGAVPRYLRPWRKRRDVGVEGMSGLPPPR